MLNEEDQAKVVAHIRKIAEGLTEHYDAVHIFASRFETDKEGGNSITVNVGEGNFYTRYGQIREWVTRKEAEAEAEARRDFE